MDVRADRIRGDVAGITLDPSPSSVTVSTGAVIADPGEDPEAVLGSARLSCIPCQAAQATSVTGSTMLLT